MRKELLVFYLAAVVGSAMAQNKENKVVMVENAPTTTSAQQEKFIKRKVAIGRFSNETQYAKGIFYDKENDPMGKQALDILSAKLAASNKFLLLERSNMDQLMQECQKNGSGNLSSIGADYLIIGSITQYGRKSTGKSSVFSNTKTQTVEAVVSIRLVDVSNGLIIYSDEAKGEAEVTSKTTMGLGGEAGYDATLSDKAISEAIGQLVNNIISKCSDGQWKTFFLSYDNEAVLIAGGKSQNVAKGDVFDVMTKGKSVKNPQTGVLIQLPGKKVGSVTVLDTGGDTPETEYSFVQVSPDAKIDTQNLSNYLIVENKK